MSGSCFPAEDQIELPTLSELKAVEPTRLEEVLAYTLLGPLPGTMSPVLFVSRMLGAYRERLMVELEQVAQGLPPDGAAKLRAVIAKARDQL